MDYSHCSAEELALQPAFQQWVLQPEDPSQKHFWENWLAHHPHKKTEAEQARRLVTLSITKGPALPLAEKRELWSRIQQTLQEKPEVRPLSRWHTWTRVAAAVSLLLIAFSVFWYLNGRQVEEKTAFGVIRQVQLPDGSRVTLNGNSRLYYPHNWASNGAREVWLEGEAFFSVTHQDKVDHARFLVHTQGITVEVLGTQFNVSQRGGNARVVLTTGKVQLSIPGKARNLVMKPGEVVEVSEEVGTVVHKNTNVEQYTSWKQQELIFEATPLAEIALILRDTYGLQVRFEQSGLQQQRISGTIPSDKLDILLLALEKSSNLKIKRNNGTIVITHDSTLK